MKIELVSLKKVKKLIPIRKKTHNKTHGGKTLVIAGQKGFFGAAVLAATASARVGSGYTTLMTDEKLFPIQRHPDFLVLSHKKIKPLILNQFQSVAVGPGLGVNAMTEKIIKLLLKHKIENVILDADALTVIAKKQIFPLRKSWLLTPHTGELARLINKQSRIQENEKINLLIKAQQKYQCSVLLKGSETYLCNSTKIRVVKTGNQSLAKSGTGDVLTGMIAGFTAQGLSTLDAASLGAYLHGVCSQIWVRDLRNDPLSLLASDLLLLIPRALKKLRSGR